jgi:hypothetical protein
MRRSARSTADGTLAALVVLLFLPPLGNVAYRELLPGGLRPLFGLRPAAERFAGEKEADRLRVELEGVRAELARHTREREILGGWDEAYAPRRARVLPVGDASPYRRSLWIMATGSGARGAGSGVHDITTRRLASDMAVVSERTLIGRTVGTLGGGRFAQVQSVLDPTFRVRFRYGSSWGFLRGTNELDPETGRPILDVTLFADPQAVFRPGDHVVTDGGDGVFPAGIVIGRLFEDAGGGARFRVLSDHHTSYLREVVVLVDEPVEELERLLRREAAGQS